MDKVDTDRLYNGRNILSIPRVDPKEPAEPPEYWEPEEYEEDD